MTPTELNAAIDRKYGHLFDLADRVKWFARFSRFKSLSELKFLNKSSEGAQFWREIALLEIDNQLTLETVRAVYPKHGIPLPEEKEGEEEAEYIVWWNRLSSEE